MVCFLFFGYVVVGGIFRGKIGENFKFGFSSVVVKYLWIYFYRFLLDLIM